MKGCELCNSPARMYCESDRASLCWECDAKVHCANFLVARHSRSLLCHACQSPTPWQATGPKVGPTVSVCDKCIGRCGGEDGGRAEAEEESHRERNEDEDDDEDDDDDDDDDDSDGGGGEDGDISDDDEEDGDNQVVPWSSSSAPPPPPPPTASSSSSDESSGRFKQAFPLKRMRDNDSFQDCSSSEQQKYNAALTKEKAKYLGLLRP